MTENKFEEYVMDNDIKATFLDSEKRCHTVQEAAEAVGTDPDDFVKADFNFPEIFRIFWNKVYKRKYIDISHDRL